MHSTGRPLWLKETTMDTCDVCKMEFSAAEPNVAVADTKLKGLGLWGFVCEAHLDYGVPHYTTRLEVPTDSMHSPSPA